jgi:hypothetical protein
MDTLSVDLQVTDDQANVVLDRAQNKIEDFASKVDGLNPSMGKKMTVDFELAERRADSVARKLAAIASTRIESGQFDGLTRAAIGLETRANSLKTELAAIRATASQATNVSILTQLQTQAKGLEAELARVELRQSRISGNSPGSGNGGGHGLSLSNIANGGQIRGAGPLFRAAGLYQYGIDESILNVANSARVAIGLSGEALAAFGGVAAAGAAIVLVSEKILSDAEKRLQTEENIAGAFNRQIKGIEQMYASYEKFKKLVESSDDFSTNISHLIKTGDRSAVQGLVDKVDADNKSKIGQIDQLQKELLRNESLLEGAKKRDTHDNIYSNRFADPYTTSQKNQDVAIRASRVEQNKKDLADLEETLKAGQNQYVQLKQGLGQITGNQNGAFDDRWEKWKKKQEDAAKAFEKSVEQAKTKINELSKTWTSAFDSLYQRTAGDNPFAVFLAKSQTEADKLKVALAGLPPELQKIAFGMQAIADAKEAFSLRLDNALSVANLRFEAGNFSDPTQQEMQRRLNADIANFRRTSNSTNPEAIAEFQRRQNAITNYNKDRQTDFLNSEYNTIYDSRRPGYDPSAADRKFVELTRGFNPDDLPDNLRRAASDARLNEAARQEKFEQDAQDERKKQTELQSKLLETQTRLLALAEKEGTAGINKLLVEVRDAPTTKSTVTSPTPADVEYNTFSGPGGLTDF